MASRIEDQKQREEMIAGIAYDIGEGYLQRLDYEKAEEQAMRSLSMYSQLDDEVRTIKVRTLLARIHMMAGDLGKAKDEFRSSLSDAKRLARKDEIGKSLLGLGETYLREGSHALAKAALAEAIQIFETINLPKERARSQELHSVALRSEVFIP
jgi:Tfp pilus assembly protein PilF